MKSDYDMIVARKKFGDVPDGEWEFIREHAMSIIDLASCLWPDRIPDDRFRQMVIAEIAHKSPEHYGKYEKCYLSNSPCKTLKTSLWNVP